MPSVWFKFRFSILYRAKEFLIAYGEVAARETIRLRARSALIHSHFNPDTLENDLAVITLSNGQTINRRHGTPIPVSCRGLFPGDEGSVASFGFNNDNSNTISDKLLVARQVIIANEPCARTFNRQLHRNQFCAQDQQPIILPPPVSEESSSSESDEEDDPPQEDPSANAMFPPLFGRRSIARNNNNGQRLTAVCRGDTGSGLVRSINNVNTLYALVSRVPEGCNNDNPAIYTNVAPFCTWLEDCTLGAVSTTNN